MKHIRVLFLSVVCSFFAVMPALAAEFTISAAASLTDVFTKLKTQFEAKHPGVIIHTNFAASNPLLRQILEGAPVSLFASADQATMDKAEAFIVPGTRRTFAANGLVLITPADQTAIKNLADCVTATRIAIGNPNSVPAGRYAREALATANLWESLSPRFIPSNSVRQVLDYVSRGEVDAGIAYATDATAAGNTVRVAAVLTGHTPVSYPLALIKPENTEARAFADFILSPQGQNILTSYGFNGE